MEWPRGLYPLPDSPSNRKRHRAKANPPGGHKPGYRCRLRSFASTFVTELAHSFPGGAGNPRLEALTPERDFAKLETAPAFSFFDGTMQGRLVPELRRASITTYEEANSYLAEIFISKYNKNFGVRPAEQGTAFIPATGADFDRIFSLRHRRTVYKDNTVHLDNRVLQLPKPTGVTTLGQRKVQIREHLDGMLEVFSGKRLIASFPPEPEQKWQHVANS